MHAALFAGLGWRDVVLLLAAMSAVYLVLSVLRLLEMAARRRDGRRPRSAAAGLAGVDAELQRLRSENTRLRDILANVATDVARLTAARHMLTRRGDTISLAPRYPPRRGVTADSANARSYQYEWHIWDENNHGRQTGSGRQHG